MKEKEGFIMANNDTTKENNKNSGQPAPLSGSHKVKNRKHSRQKKHSHHSL
jgi:small acid-soluble spore protein P (minor)